MVPAKWSRILGYDGGMYILLVPLCLALAFLVFWVVQLANFDIDPGPGFEFKQDVPESPPPSDFFDWDVFTEQWLSFSKQSEFDLVRV